MIIGSAALTRKMDEMCMDTFKIPSIVLMENAASAATKRIEEILDSQGLCGQRLFTILSGAGNNGGDGLVIARKLSIMGHRVRVIFIGQEEKMTESTRTNMDIIRSMGIEILSFEHGDYHMNDTKMTGILKQTDYLIDSLFGVGLNRDLDFSYIGLIGMVNRAREMYSFKTIAIDTPSGIDPTSGQIMGDAIEADYTITFEYFKEGFLNYSIEDYLGQVFVEPIGIPDKVYNNIERQDRTKFGASIDQSADRRDFISGRFVDIDYINDILKDRKPSSNKSDLGKVLIYAGSKGYYGAAYLASRAASKTGSGLVTLVSDEDTIGVNATRLVEEMTCLDDDKERLEKLLAKADAIAFGPGKADKRISKVQLESLLGDLESGTNKPSLVIDAGGLDVFDPSRMAKGKDVIMTPHSGEFARMIGLSPSEVDQNRFQLAKGYAARNGIVLVLKGKNTIISDGNRTYVNTTGNPAMANGGMGDALTGIITSLCGQGYEAFEAAVLGVYLHGLIGDVIFKNKYVINARDLIKMIPKTIKILYNRKK